MSNAVNPFIKSLEIIYPPNQPCQPSANAVPVYFYSLTEQLENELLAQRVLSTGTVEQVKSVAMKRFEIFCSVAKIGLSIIPFASGVVQILQEAGHALSAVDHTLEQVENIEKMALPAVFIGETFSKVAGKKKVDPKVAQLRLTVLSNYFVTLVAVQLLTKFQNDLKNCSEKTAKDLAKYHFVYVLDCISKAPSDSDAPAALGQLVTGIGNAFNIDSSAYVTSRVQTYINQRKQRIFVRNSLPSTQCHRQLSVNSAPLNVNSAPRDNSFSVFESFKIKNQGLFTRFPSIAKIHPNKEFRLAPHAVEVPIPFFTRLLKWSSHYTCHMINILDEKCRLTMHEDSVLNENQDANKAQIVELVKGRADPKFLQIQKEIEVLRTEFENLRAKQNELYRDVDVFASRLDSADERINRSEGEIEELKGRVRSLEVRNGELVHIIKKVSTVVNLPEEVQTDLEEQLLAEDRF